jgi:hypothetical protein
MKKLILSILALATVAMITPMFVKVSAADMTCAIPFDFSVNGKLLPAGNYVFSTKDSTVMINGWKKGAVVVTNGLQDPRNHDTKAVFDRTGDRYVLREVWVVGAGHQVPKTRADKARLASGAPVETIVIRGM